MIVTAAQNSRKMPGRGPRAGRARETGGTTAGRRLAARRAARGRTGGNTEPAHKRARAAAPWAVASALNELSNFFVDVAAAGLSSRRGPCAMPREVQMALEEHAAQLNEEQKHHVFAIISEQTELDLDQEDDEGAFVDVDFGTLDPVTLWKLHAYIYSRLCFGPILARTHGLRYEGGVFLA